ncbi:MAG: hypothetical protein ACOCYO_08145 [Bacteroidota bacterium]
MQTSFFNNKPAPAKEYYFVGIQREKERLQKAGFDIVDLSVGIPTFLLLTRFWNR